MRNAGCGVRTNSEERSYGRALDMQNKELSRAKNSAYRYLALRPRSRAEVEKKLQDREFPPEVVRSVIEHLIRLGYLDDAKFAVQWASSRIRLRGFGRRRIEQELRTRGVSREVIQEALEGVFDESPEIEIARREAGKKLKGLGRYEPDVRRRRLAGHLERRGFPAGIIHAILHDFT